MPDERITISLTKDELNALESKIKAAKSTTVDRNKEGNLIWRGNYCVGVVGHLGARAHDWEEVTEGP